MVRNFNADTRSAFLGGFASGLTAPVSLFAVHPAPALPQVPRVHAPSRDLGAALQSDWLRIGDSLQLVIGRYERQQEEPSSD